MVGTGGGGLTEALRAQLGGGTRGDRVVLSLTKDAGHVILCLSGGGEGGGRAAYVSYRDDEAYAKAESQGVGSRRGDGGLVVECPGSALRILLLPGRRDSRDPFEECAVGVEGGEAGLSRSTAFWRDAVGMRLITHDGISAQLGYGTRGGRMRLLATEGAVKGGLRVTVSVHPGRLELLEGGGSACVASEGRVFGGVAALAYPSLHADAPKVHVSRRKGAGRPCLRSRLVSHGEALRSLSLIVLASRYLLLLPTRIAHD